MSNEPNERSALTRFARPGALIAVGLLAGGIAATTLSASAQTSTSPSPSTSSSVPAAPASPGTPAAPKDLDSPTPVRSDETLLTGTNAEKAKAAALKAVPGGTIIRLETDSGPAEYEAHMKKADGSQVTVLFDANFNVTSIEEGMGGRGPGDKHPGFGTGTDRGPGRNDTTPATPSASNSA